MPSRPIARTATAVLLLLTMVLTACSSTPEDPSDALAAAFEDTFSATFAYRLTVDAEAEALEALAADAGELAPLIAGVSVDGVRDDDAVSVRVEGLGSDLLELRSLEGEILYARLGIRDLLAMAGAVDPEQVIAAAGLELSPEVEEAVIAALDGRWIALEGDLSQVAEDAATDAASEGADGAAAALEGVLGGDLTGFFERFVTIDDGPRGEVVRTYGVSLELRELLRAVAELDALGSGGGAVPDLEADLADLPERVPGTVETRDGLVSEVRFDVAATMSEAGTDLPGDLELVLEISDHDEVAPIVAPDDALALDPAQLQEALGALGRLGGVGAP